ncbi:MAG: hypothetical protein HC798_01040 [Polaribacter sp.]|nr:hypothetical protein [Polaribacter sp.]
MQEDWKLLRDWYANNPSVNTKPDLVFPLDVTLENGTVQTLIDTDELRAVKQNCRADRDRRKCFQFVLPATFTMPDATTITVTTRSDYRQIRAWYKANTRVRVRPVVVFPVDIEYKNGTTATINNAIELLAARVSCD